MLGGDTVKKLYRMVVLIILSLVTSFASSDELVMRNWIMENVENLFMYEKFNKLDFLSERYRKSSKRTDSGLWKLTIFYNGIDSLFDFDADDEYFWSVSRKRIDTWLQKSPKSPAANIAKGILLYKLAWAIRGGSWAKDVPKTAWKPFKDNLRVAKKHMLDTKKIAARDPHWYVIMADIQKGLNEDTKTFNKIISEGLEMSPNYYQLYFSAISYLAPKWHGDKQQIENFANKAVKRTKSSEGMGMYARIYWFASQVQYDERLFSESMVVWKKMKKGIYDVIKRYPDSWNVQNFAFFSCLAKDKETTRMLFDKISGPMIEKAWKKKTSYDACRKFAYSDISSSGN